MVKVLNVNTIQSSSASASSTRAGVFRSCLQLADVNYDTKDDAQDTSTHLLPLAFPFGAFSGSNNTLSEASLALEATR